MNRIRNTFLVLIIIFVCWFLNLFNMRGFTSSYVFLCKYRNEDFSQFVGFDLLRRGVDHDGNTFVHISSQGSDLTSLPVVVAVNNDSQETTRFLFHKEQIPYGDSILLVTMTYSFLHYSVPRLAVNLKGIVSVYPYNHGSQNLELKPDTVGDKIRYRWRFM